MQKRSSAASYAPALHLLDCYGDYARTPQAIDDAVKLRYLVAAL